MTPRIIPDELDRHALAVARNIATVDRNRLPGAEEQFIAILHEAIVASMWVAIERHVRRESPGTCSPGRVLDGGGQSRPFRDESRDQQGLSAVGSGRGEVPTC